MCVRVCICACACVCVCVCVRVCACAWVCVRTCVRACVWVGGRACVRIHIFRPIVPYIRCSLYSTVPHNRKTMQGRTGISNMFFLRGCYIGSPYSEMSYQSISRHYCMHAQRYVTITSTNTNTNTNTNTCTNVGEHSSSTRRHAKVIYVRLCASSLCTSESSLILALFHCCNQKDDGNVMMMSLSTYEAWCKRITLNSNLSEIHSMAAVDAPVSLGSKNGVID